MLRVVPARHLELLGLAGLLAEVEVGSGLPPSAHTRRSIISFNGLGHWYQYTGVTMITACAAVQRS